jgi:uncharacterized HAD superfamily protein
MRIAIDIDSTLHHYWDVLSDTAQRRFGIDLPYEEQIDWGVTRLREEQFQLCVEETHSESAILAGRPYPGAVEAVNEWHRDGHFIHITSHRQTTCQSATERWLNEIGLEYDELYCSFDKVGRCRELEIGLLIDDAPENLVKAVDNGIVAATIAHPWNRDVCEEEDIIAAADWAELVAKLDRVFSTPAS